MKDNHSKNVQLVLDILKNEVDGDVQSALNKTANDYSMTWVYQKENGELFPSTKKTLEKELEEVYIIKDRKYLIKNIAEAENLVVIEMIESYPDPETGNIYRTPQVIVLELQNGRIKTGRHYCDPKVSYLHLSEEKIKEAYKNRTKEDLLIS